MGETAMPTGTVTFLFTDIEGSTRTWQAEPDAMARAVEAHDQILRASIEAADGYVFALGGDSFAASFATAAQAASAATDAQAALTAHAWPTSVPIRVRMGLHTGSAEERDGNYFGPAVNRAARIMSAGHGGQVLLSGVSAAVVGPEHPVRPLGERRLADVEEPEMVHQLGDANFPPLRAVQVFTCDIPAARTPLIGRETELAAVRRAMASSRLVTLVGAGGSGKTRLAFEAARAAQLRFEAGVRLVDLTVLSDSVDVAPSIAVAVEAATGGDPVAAAVDAIGSRDLMLVVDNCEHVIEAAADSVDALIAACPKVRVLATSREPLEIEGEVVYPVPPLDPAGAATELYQARVEATGVDASQFAQADVAALCARLDGLPLAVELAAARARTLAPLEVVARLDAGAELGTGRRRRRRRHDTLAETIAWSYDLLSAGERAVLRRCALFEADFSSDAVEATSGLDPGDAMDGLDGLVAKSLVVRDVSPLGHGGSRYRLLETIRDFAAQRLDTEDDTDGAHSLLIDYIVGLAREWSDGRNRRLLLDELVSQRATIASAGRFAATADRLDDLAKIVQLAMMAWIAEPTAANPFELIDDAQLERLPGDVRGELIVEQAIRLINLGDIGGCRAALDRALALSGRRATHVAASARSIQARLDAYLDPARALRESEQSLTLRQRAAPAPDSLISGESAWMFHLHDHASVQVASGDAAGAWETLMQAIRVGPDVNPLAYHMLFTDLLWVSTIVGRSVEALELSSAAIAQQQALSRRWLPGRDWLPLAEAAARAAAGSPEEARRGLLACVESWADPLFASLWPLALVSFGVVAFHSEDHDRAVRLCEPQPMVAMPALMTRHHVRGLLGAVGPSDPPFVLGADPDPHATRRLVDDEVRHARTLLTEA